MIAPMLPGSEDLPELLAGKVDTIILDRMNYNHSTAIYRQNNLADKMTDEYFEKTSRFLYSAFTRLKIECQQV